MIQLKISIFSMFFDIFLHFQTLDERASKNFHVKVSCAIELRFSDFHKMTAMVLR